MELLVISRRDRFGMNTSNILINIKIYFNMYEQINTAVYVNMLPEYFDSLPFVNVSNIDRYVY